MISNLYKSMVAGMAIALGGWIYLMTANPIVGAALFACGLLTVRIYNLDLFTGRIQYMVTKEFPWYYYPIILLGNFIGAALIGCVSMLLVRETAAFIAASKAAQSLPIAFFKGVGCGMLMSFATNKNTPLWATVMGVAAFILAGMNHCIADMYYMIAGTTFSWTIVATILGNIAGGIIFSSPTTSNT